MYSGLPFVTFQGTRSARAQMAAVVFICCLQSLPKLSASERPGLATTDSPWNVLAYGGKGEMHGAPICHSLDYFSKSPFALDFDDDFFDAREADFLVHADSAPRGAIGWQRIYEVKQTVARRQERSATPASSMPPTLMIILLERRAGEFCDIYQNQYTYDPRQEREEISIIDISGVKVLKVFQTDRRTCYLAYWAIRDHEPIRLSPDGLYTAIRSASPPGAAVFDGCLSITGSHFTANIFGGGPGQDLLGEVYLELTVQANEIRALRKTWIPTSTHGK